MPQHIDVPKKTGQSLLSRDLMATVSTAIFPCRSIPTTDKPADARRHLNHPNSVRSKD